VSGDADRNVVMVFTLDEPGTGVNDAVRIGRVRNRRRIVGEADLVVTEALVGQIVCQPRVERPKLPVHLVLPSPGAS